MARKKRREPDCEGCSKAPPRLLPENEPVYSCLLLCSRQLRVAFAGAYALDWNVVGRVADDMGIGTDEAFWDAVRICEGIIIENLPRGKNDDR